MRVYLTGFMASGKSTVGPEAAARLGQPFLDLDRLITAHAGRSIPTLFAEDGGERFRELESNLLRRTATTDDLVVALGGGALVDDGNRAFAKDHGLVLYLEAPVDTVLDRVAGDDTRRPLLEDDTGSSLSRAEQRTRIEEMLDTRRPTYEAAHHTLDADRPVEGVVARIVEVVSGQAA
ncbi:shikimate kinase [Salinibacter altiplanensis]|uniref:shikimate kinase n=1 Tax=Salinibacter altiplanensis TaxID=1803181 RepID=UPI001F2B2E98|nr:shikimate kinase [Salinibacter altiplanensis]